MSLPIQVQSQLYHFKSRILALVAAQVFNAWCEIVSAHQSTKSVKASGARPSCAFNQMQKLCKAILAAKRT
jgi:hypothetical protein